MNARKKKKMIKIKGTNRTKGTEVKGIPQPKQKNGAKQQQSKSEKRK